MFYNNIDPGILTLALVLPIALGALILTVFCVIKVFLHKRNRLHHERRLALGVQRFHADVELGAQPWQSSISNQRRRSK